MRNGTHKYDDILNLPHHVSPKRAHMSMVDRGAQFSPFAALTGYDAVIQETARLTESPVELDEDALAALDAKLRLLRDAADSHPEVTFSCFQPDGRKEGGACVRVTGQVKKIDSYARAIVLMDNQVIPMERILDMEGPFAELNGGWFAM